MSERAVGYIYIIFGTFLIILALLSVYMVFNNKWKAVDLFSLPGISLDMTEFFSAELPREQIENLEETQGLRTEIVQPDVINQPLNLIAHLLFMGFAVNVGYKIASLGVQFVRPIKVSLREGGEKSV